MTGRLAFVLALPFALACQPTVVVHPTPVPPAQVVVTNNMRGAATIYVVRSNGHSKIGVVASQATETFDIPAPPYSTITLVALVKGDSPQTSRTVTALPGALFEWELDPSTPAPLRFASR